MADRRQRLANRQQAAGTMITIYSADQTAGLVIFAERTGAHRGRIGASASRPRLLKVGKSPVAACRLAGAGGGAGAGVQRGGVLIELAEQLPGSDQVGPVQGDVGRAAGREIGPVMAADSPGRLQV